MLLFLLFGGGLAWADVSFPSIVCENQGPKSSVHLNEFAIYGSEPTIGNPLPGIRFDHTREKFVQIHLFYRTGSIMRRFERSGKAQLISSNRARAHVQFSFPLYRHEQDSFLEITLPHGPVKWSSPDSSIQLRCKVNEDPGFPGGVMGGGNG